ncbi:MAG TPA: hypothetical protein VF064_16300 [Pyrinomonadaceae bacterium]
MTDTPKKKGYGRVFVILLVVGLLVLVPLTWLALRMSRDAQRRRVVNANEAAAIYTLEQIAAAEQLHFETYEGQYATFRQLLDAGLFKAPLEGDAAITSAGYTFTLKLTPRTDAQGSFYSVNADPRESGTTGNRHFYIDSNITGMRFSEGRPATATDPPRLTAETY